MSDLVSVVRDGADWTYFFGCFPIHRHGAGNRSGFLLAVSSLVEGGACRQKDILQVFGVSRSCLARAARRYREKGADGFLSAPLRGRRGGTVLTAEVLSELQRLLDEGASRRAAAEEMGVLYGTLCKAVQDGRLRPGPLRTGTDKSSRSAVDAAAAEGLGTACTRPEERTLAAFGLLDGAEARFEPCRDVPFGGVLCAVPALLANGLLDGAEGLLNQVKGYYTMAQVLLLLGFMALCRIRTIEKLKAKSPGEFGKLLGLDRIPEVRCLRNRLTKLGENGAAERWAEYLSRRWMEDNPEMVGTLLIDGSVRPYSGDERLPRRFAARLRLCVRGTTDYWICDALGVPFFAVEKTVDPGLLRVLREDIVPRLLRDVPGQPSDEELAADPLRCRFALVFDREGYSPGFFREMWRRHRIACVTYHKHPKGIWPDHWFAPETLTMPGGQIVEVSLAEMGSLVGTGSDAMWMREIRKRTDTGHQVSLIATIFEPEAPAVAAKLFTRWCQENFFKYMKENFALDVLAENSKGTVPDTETVVNPAWREAEKLRRRVQGKLTRRQAKFAALELGPAPEIDSRKFARWQRSKAVLLEDIGMLQQEIEELKGKLRITPRHIQWGQLPEEHKFGRLAPTRRRLLETVRMIAYRAETAMVPLLDLPSAAATNPRALLQALYQTAADIIPDTANRTIHVRIHRAATPAADKRIENLCQALNEAQIQFPATDMVLAYSLLPLPETPGTPPHVSPELPPGKDL